MGIDVSIYIQVELDDDQIAAANQYLVDRGIDGNLQMEPASQWPSQANEERWAYLHTGDRIYIDVNRRGHWPQIHHALRCVMALFPDAKILYGDDSRLDPNGREVTPEMLESLWQVWLSPDGRKR
jgi:hypothetical protein